MINSFEGLDADVSSIYKSNVLEKIYPLLTLIDIKQLSNESYIDNSNDRLTISLIHKDDQNSRLTLNIFNDRVSIWYGPCNVSYHADMEEEVTSRELEYLLKSKYFSTDFTFNGKLLYSIITFEDNIITRSRVNYSMFSSLYVLFFKNRIKSNIKLYKTFISSLV